MKLIDADKLLENYKKWIPQLSSKEDEGDRRGVETCIAVLEDTPAVDAVPVVRCWECKNYVIVDEFEGGKRYMCLVNHFSYLDNDGDNQFCSYGERKEGAD